MGHYSKDIYDKKREFAYKKSIKSIGLIAEKLNKEKGIDYDTLLEELEPIDELSHKRHELHSTDRTDFYSLENVEELLQQIGTQYSTDEDLIDKVNKLNKKYNLAPISLRKIDEDKPNTNIDSYSDIIDFYGEDIPNDDDDDEIKRKALDLLYEDWDKEINNWSDSVREWFYYINEKFGSEFPYKTPETNLSLKNKSNCGILMF